MGLPHKSMTADHMGLVPGQTVRGASADRQDLMPSRASAMATRRRGAIASLGFIRLQTLATVDHQLVSYQPWLNIESRIGILAQT